MTTVLRAELLKLRVTRSLWAVPVIGAVLSVVGSVLVVSLVATHDLPDRLSAHGPLRFGPTNVGLILLVFGIRLFGDETHHRTLASTYISTPRRRQVFAAKAIVASAVALTFCIAVFALVVPITLIGIHARDIAMDADTVGTAGLLIRTSLAMVLTAVIGVAVAAVVRNRAVALVAALAWLALVEQLAGTLLKVPELLPGAIVRALVSGHSGPDALGAPTAALVLAGITAAAIAAAASRLNDDIS